MRTTLHFSIHDFNLGIVVKTPEGNGVLKSVDIQGNAIVEINIVGDVQFKLHELTYPSTQINLAIANQVGIFVLIFQRVENRMRDFLIGALALDIKAKKNLTAGLAKLKITKLLHDRASKDQQEVWSRFEERIVKMTALRNTIIHGYAFTMNEQNQLDFAVLNFINPNGEEVFLDFKKLYAHVVDCFNLYEELSLFFVQTDLTSKKTAVKD